MSFLKRRAWHGVLALVCILTGIFSFSPLPVTVSRAYAAAGPDLYIDSIVWSPEQPNIGTLTNFTVTVKNQGDAPSAASHIGFFIDENFADYASVSPVNPGGSISLTFSWKATAGEHIVKAFIDNEETVAEADENNNEKTYAFSVLAPDLIVASIVWSPGSPSTGDSVTFTVTVKNQGNKAASSCWFDFLMDGVSRGAREGQPLDPGESFTSKYVWVAQPGQHLLQATADTMGQVTEGNEINNDLTRTYCTTPPDLIVESISYSPANRTESGNVTMTVAVKNQGEGSSIGSWLTYYIDNKVKKSVYIPSLEAGAKGTASYIWPVGPEGHVFKAVIDDSDVIFESDETNNTRSVTLLALGLPDLIIQDITWTPAKPTVNSRMTFTVTVKNIGPRTVDIFNLYLYITYGWKLAKQPGPIAPGATITVNLPWITSQVPAKIRAVVDEENFIAEADEANNEKYASLTPVEPVATADITIESIVCTPSVPVPGEYVTIKVTVKNQGPSTSKASDITCYVDDALLGFMYFPELGPGKTVARSMIWKATTGEHRVKVIADSFDGIFETNEANNEKTATILTTSADLAVEKIEWFPLNPVIGKDVEFTITVKNQGDRPSGPCYLTYYIDGAPQGTHYLDKMAAGASVTRSFSWNMQAASCTFTAVIDKDDTVAESDETNNEKSVLLPAPDILIDSVTCSDDYPLADTALTFTVNIRNAGWSGASSTHVSGYVDGNLIATLESGDINAGQSVESVFTWVAVPGKHTLRVIIDPENNIPETNESDNSKEVIIFVPLPSGVDETGGETATPPDTNQGTGAIISPTPTDINPEDLFDDLDEEEVQEISGNISATPDEPSRGIKDILMNKWLLLGVAGAGIAAIGALIILRNHSSQPKKPKTEKPVKANPDRKVKTPAKLVAPVKAGDTLSGKPAVLVPPPPKPAAKPGIAPPIKPVVPPGINTAAGQNLGATLIKQSNQPPPPGTPQKPDQQ